MTTSTDLESATRHIRLARGALAAGTATFTALLSHVGGGGSMPGWLGILLPFVFALLACMFVARRSPSLPRLIVSVILSQFLFHTLFVLGVSDGAGSGLQQTGHHGFVIVASKPTLTPSMADAGVDTPMWAGHAVAAVLTILALHFGERLLLLILRLADLVRHWWSRQLHVATALAIPIPTSVPRMAHAVHSWTLLLLATSASRRGPPSGCRPLPQLMTIT